HKLGTQVNRYSRLMFHCIHLYKILNSVIERSGIQEDEIDYRFIRLALIDILKYWTSDILDVRYMRFL
ncbi:MAG: hypothetical protein KAQ65_12285, partial [Candidatus Thorarchaeota archaeon]|nr:hypothetical protein [Candidatus Thorarchaeota archaeon]